MRQQNKQKRQTNNWGVKANEECTHNFIFKHAYVCINMYICIYLCIYFIDVYAYAYVLVYIDIYINVYLGWFIKSRCF